MSEERGGFRTIRVRQKRFLIPSTHLFPDFLGQYLKLTLGGDWGNAELAKPFADRHPLIQWYDALCRYQQETIKTPGVPHEAKPIGVVGAYLGLAHGLCIIDSQVDLPPRLLARLREKASFQGAYYEVMVAAGLARAGFDLAFENEDDGSSKHCELTARSLMTGKIFSVEARMRAVQGLFGKNSTDGSARASAVARLGQHLNGAFEKPAKGERFIFIDLNASIDATVSEDNQPEFLDQVRKRLALYERRELKPGERAYVFITSFSYHRQLDGDAALFALPYGLGIEFNKAGAYRLSDRYRHDVQHVDAFAAAEGFAQHSNFPKHFGTSSVVPSRIEFVLPKSKLESNYDPFKWLVHANRALPRDQMLSWFSASRDMSVLSALSDEDLLLEYCEGQVAGLDALKRK